MSRSQDVGDQIIMLTGRESCYVEVWVQEMLLELGCVHRCCVAWLFCFFRGGGGRMQARMVHNGCLTLVMDCIPFLQEPCQMYSRLGGFYLSVSCQGVDTLTSVGP